MLEKDFMIWVASLTGKFMFLDSTVFALLTNDLLKGIPFGIALMLAWIYADKVFTIRMVLVIFLSVLAARLSQNLWVSPRPIMVPEIGDHFTGMAKGTKLDWNSFPSDHMALYFPIALMTFLRFRSYGIFLIAWSILGVGLPRIFFGRHYPSDILGGMAVGTAIFALVWSLKNKIDPWLLKVSNRCEANSKVALSIMFILSYQVSTVFDNLRYLGFTIKNVFQFYIQKL